MTAATRFTRVGLAVLASSVVLFSIATSVFAQPPSAEAIQKFRERSETLRRGQIASLEHRLRGLTSGQVASANKERELARIRSDLQALRSRQRSVVPTLDYPPSVGDIGRLPGIGGHVERVIGPRELVVTCSFPVLVTTTRNGRSRAVRINRSVLFQVQGVDTNEVHVGMDVPLAQVFAITSRQENDGVEVFTAVVFDPPSIKRVPGSRGRR